MAGTGWDHLTLELSALISDLHDGQVIITEHGDRYVQLRRGTHTLTAEAVANQFLPPAQQLTEDDGRRLIDLGWHSPRPPDRHNWWRDHAWPLSPPEIESLATHICSTLREVYKVPAPADLTRQILIK